MIRLVQKIDRTVSGHGKARKKKCVVVKKNNSIWYVTVVQL